MAGTGGKFYYDYLEQRRLGMKYRHVKSSYKLKRNEVDKQLYRDMLRKSSVDSLIYEDRSFDYKTNTYGHYNNIEAQPTGGIFNLDFSPDGSILGAACERKTVLLFDPITRKISANVLNAHDDFVNCIRFLDNRLFATCSDDTTVALWDARYLKRKLRTLKGHSNWVKNIEFSRKENCLVTSGFDGAIYTWDINKYSENADEANRAYYTNGLMRMRLTPSWDRMVISTMTGYMMIIHDLSLEHMADDLSSFKPNMYRLMQMSGNPLRVAFDSTKLFHAKRNRVELISDFAPSNDADNITSLQMHPQGWVAVSRNVSSDEKSEWCCVHDIQSYEVNEEDDRLISASNASNREAPANPEQAGTERSGFARLAEYLQAIHPMELPLSLDNNAEPAGEDNVVPGEEFHVRQRNPENRDDREIPENDDDNGVDNDRSRGRRVSDILAMLGQIARNRREAAASGEAAGPSREANNGQWGNNDSSGSEDENQGFLLMPASPGGGARPRIFFLPGSRSGPRARAGREQNIPPDARIHHNVKRLTHYIEESNRGRGFIKEVSFSPDGLILASPYDCGVRLLAFNERIDDLAYCAPKGLGETPRQLHVVGTIADCHKEPVLSTAFSPHQFILVTGCLSGSIVWHQPFI